MPETKEPRGARATEAEYRRRKEGALMRLREIEVATLEEKLVPAEQVSHRWARIAASLRDAVLRIPDRCAPAAYAAGTVQEARALLQQECETILRTLSNDLRSDPGSNRGRRSRGTAA